MVCVSPALADGGGTAEIKAYLVGKLQRMDKGAHDYVANVNAYQALTARLKSEYGDILSFIGRVDTRERASGSKVTAAQIKELAYQAKRLTDQLTPHLKQMAKELDLRLPPKPTLV